jgi:hypothetical protein
MALDFSQDEYFTFSLIAILFYRDHYRDKLVDKTHINDVFDTSTIAVEKDYRHPPIIQDY